MRAMGNFEFEVAHLCDIEVLGPSFEANTSILSNSEFAINKKYRTHFFKSVASFHCMCISFHNGGGGKTYATIFKLETSNCR